MRPTAAPADAAETSYPISTRLSEAQKRWVEEAANIKGWTPANFIRLAAVEKAVHLLNTSRPNKLDFDSLAARVAKQLCKPEVATFDDRGEKVIPPDDYDEGPFSTEAERISSAELAALREAMRLGGAEFMAAVLDRCARILGPSSGVELPDPIQPE